MNKKGFTLIELLAVIVILGLIAVLVIPVVSHSVSDARESLAETSVYGYKRAIEKSYFDNQGNFDGVYTINSNGVLSKSNGDTIAIEASGKRPSSGFLTIVDGEVVSGCLVVNNYTVTLSGGEVSNIDKEDCPTLTPLESDSWKTVIENLKSNVHAYDSDTNFAVGKPLYMDVDGDGKKESYNVRIVNTSTPEACGGEDFSQTACGLVFEFTDIISLKTWKGNNASCNVGISWSDSYLRSYLNNDLYNALPDEMQKMIIDTKVVPVIPLLSSNPTSITVDKLYLLSSEELGQEYDYSEGEAQSRVLDYYNGSTASSRIKTYNGVATGWWARNRWTSGSSYTSQDFISSEGAYGSGGCSQEFGVVPAFRVALN